MARSLELIMDAVVLCSFIMSSIVFIACISSFWGARVWECKSGFCSLLINDLLDVGLFWCKLEMVPRNSAGDLTIISEIGYIF